MERRLGLSLAQVGAESGGMYADVYGERVLEVRKPECPQREQWSLEASAAVGAAAGEAGAKA